MTFPGRPPDASDVDLNGELMLTDFTSNYSDLGWYVVNDNVMGGQSEGDFEQEQGALIFTGRTNTDGGGFSSIRTKPVQLDLSGHEGIQLHVKGDGRRYTWRLTTAAHWRGQQVSYRADFATRNGTWTTVDIPFRDFIPKVRGTQLAGPALDTSQITGMGLMIYDDQDGPFVLHVASVKAYATAAPFALEQYRWRSRVLVVSAPTRDDKNLRDLLEQVVSTAEEFASHDMVLVTLLDKAVSTAGDRQLTTGESAAARAALGIRPGPFALKLIGKDGSVKFSSETATSITEIYALVNSMPMRLREKTERE